MFACSPCCSSDKVWDTVKVDISAMESEDKENARNMNQRRSMQEKPWPEDGQEAARVEAERQRLQKERQEAARCREEERRLEEARLEEQRREQRREEERLEQERLEQERFEQEARQAKEEVELARQEEERKVADEQRKQAMEMQEELARVATEADAAALSKFLEKHRYTGANAKRTRLLKSKYPLHTAVKLRDTNMIRVLLAAQADRTLRNSLGETPSELAARLFKNNGEACALVQQALQG